MIKNPTINCTRTTFLNPEDAPWLMEGGGGVGTGDVVGPASSTDNALARFDGTSGKVIQNSVVTLSDTGAFLGVTTINTHTVPGGAPGTFALVSQITGTNSGTNTGDQTITLTGDVTGSGTGTFAATIGNDKVTYAKMQNVSAAAKLLGRGDSGSGDPQEITLGTGLTMTGTTLSCSVSGGSGDVVGPASATDTVFPRYDGTTGKLIKDSSVTCDDSGNILTPGTLESLDLRTSDPGGGQANWKLGQVQSSFGLIIHPTLYVEVMINDSLVKLAIAQVD